MAWPAELDYPIKKIVVGKRRRALGDVSALSASIAQIGLLNRIHILPNGALVAGYHRLEACKALGWECIPARVLEFDELDAELAEIDENLRRNDLTIIEHGEHLQRRGEILEAKGLRAKQGDNRFTNGRGDTVSPLQTTNGMAAEMGKSERTAQRYLQIARNVAEDVKEAIAETATADSVTQLLALARMEPEQQREVAEAITAGGAKSVRDAMRVVNKRERLANPPAPIAGKYRVWYADPPWHYGNNGVITESDNYGRAERHYPTMTIEQLCAMGKEIKVACEQDAVLFLWVTSPLLAECFPVITAWGFKYKTSMVWNKDAHNFGHYVSVRHELLLICTRGSCLPDIKELLPSVVTIRRSKTHSQKPDEFREMIDKMYPQGSRIELFARAEHEKWARWGNECS